MNYTALMIIQYKICYIRVCMCNSISYYACKLIYIYIINLHIMYKENNGKSFISKEFMSSALEELVKDFG